LKEVAILNRRYGFSRIMAIPNALIPSDEKRSVNKPRLVFAVVVIGLFGLATVGSLISVVLKQFTPALTDEDVVVVGYLAAFQCQKQQGRITDAQGRKILQNLVKGNGMDASILQRPMVVKTADFYAQSLDESCGSGDRDEVKEIRQLSEQVRKRGRFS
tara:strand:+ start:32 stop:508 length:477 start_codon:yes stop_codon:yes gene_type:complete